MANSFGIAIASKLSCDDIRTVTGFPHKFVLDIRRGKNGGAFPIEESTMKKLANFQVDYHQKPIDLRKPTFAEGNALVSLITDRLDNTLLLTDDVSSAVGFCKERDIPFVCNELYVIDAAKTTRPTSSRINSVECAPLKNAAN